MSASKVNEPLWGVRGTKQILFLANEMGGCSLDGIPARLDLSGRLPRVIDTTGRSAAFNPSVVETVVIKKGGRFATRELRRFAA